MFISNNNRRIVEIDFERLGTISEPWIADDFSFLPVLNTEEKQVAEAVQRLLDGDPESGIDDPAVAETVLAAVDDYRRGDEWFVADLRIDGDRAWARVRGTGTIGLPFSFRLIADEWTLDSDGMCTSLLYAGSGC